MNKLTINDCPLCGSTQLKHTMTCTDAYASGKQFELFCCKECDFMFTQGAPAGDDMNNYYATSEYISHSDTKKGVMNTIYHWVRNYMLGRKARLVAKTVYRSTGKLLDIGTGTGYFPDAMRKRGWEVEGIEKNAQARTFAKENFDLDIKDEKALDAFEEGAFDVVTLWHVMEHLEHLNETWDRLYALLAEKGILIVAVPNRVSYDAEKYGANWAAYDVPRHLWHFTPATIQQLASKHGFIMAERYPMPFDAFYVSMLSEKQMKHFGAFLRGAYIGLMAWFSALGRKERSSSMIYIFRKKRNER